MKSKPKSIDECPVRGCGQWVPGIDPAELTEGADYVCRGGHVLFVTAGDVATLEPFREPSGRIQRLPR